jgi:drug/metabolite transporter (DMT)-like permease
MIRWAIRGGEGLVRRSGARAQLFAAGMLFGLLAVLTRLATQGGFSAGQVAVVRYAVGALLAMGLFVHRPGTFAPVKYGLLAARGALGGLAGLLYFLALSLIPAGEATLLNNTFPVIATVLSVFTLRERPTIHLALALSITTAGVFLALGGGTASFGLGWGQAAGAASAVLGAGAVTSIRVLRATDNAPTIFFAFCLGGLAVSWPFAFGRWPGDPLLWLLAVGGVGVSSSLAQLLMTHAYGALTVPEAAVWQQLTPVASTLWALALLDERVTGLAAAGVLLGAGGVAYGSILGHRPRAAGAVEPGAVERPPVRPA